MTNLSATATAHAAVSIINATATGRGAALAVAGGVKATWTWREEPGVHLDADVDDRLASAVLAVVQEELDRAPPGAYVTTTSPCPPSRGLKTSSSAAAAMIQAAHDALGLPVGEADHLRLAVDASRRAGVTLTGAYDDQVAVVRGGCHLTDNTIPAILRVVPTRPWHVAVWVPQAAIPKTDLTGIDARSIRAEIQDAERALKRGHVADAMQQNGDAFMVLYRQHGLPVDDAPVTTALRHGAEAAGLSGTGPAVAALFADHVDLPPVAGGTWRWTRVVPVEGG